MAEKSTFIKIDRNITEWRWYQNANTFRVFIHLLLKANINDKDFENITIHRGEFATSRENLAKALGLSVQQTRTALEHLKSTGEITIKRYSKFQVISVINYDFYQSFYENQPANQPTINQQSTNNQPTINQQSTNNQPSNNHQSTTIKEYKERKESKECKEEKNKGKMADEPPSPIHTPDEEKPKNKKSNKVVLSDIIQDYTQNQDLRNALNEFAEMRKSQKKQLTERALKTCLKKLDSLAETDEMKIAVVDQTIERCWLTFYPLHNNQPFYQQNQTQQQQDISSPDAYKDDNFFNINKLLNGGS